MEIEVLYIVTFYRIRCIHNIHIMRAICKVLRDKIDKYILQDATFIHHEKWYDGNFIECVASSFPRLSVLSSLKNNETFHIQRNVYNDGKKTIDLNCPAVIWNSSFISKNSEILIYYYIFVKFGFPDLEHTEFPGFELIFKTFPENSRKEIETIDIYLIKKTHFAYAK